jgi:outer membrane cobalamin receptor
MFLTLIVGPLMALNLSAAEITGRVTDARSGKAIQGVEVSCRDSSQSVRTDSDGRFDLHLDADGCTLQISAAGYRPATLPVTGSTALDVMLAPDVTATQEAVQVHAGAYAEETAGSVGLSGDQLQYLASSLGDDPLRAVQALPGVTAENDFSSQFAMRGADYSRIGLFVDGVLLHAPFDYVHGDSSGASITDFQSSIVNSATLIPGPIPSRYSDRTAGVLDLESRDVSPSRTRAQLNAGILSVEGSAEGGLGRKGTWLAAGRQSYLQYIVNRVTSTPGLAFGFRDAQAKITYALTPSNQVSLLLLEGFSSLNRNSAQSQLGLNSIDTGHVHTTTPILSWRFTPRSDWSITNRVAYLRERFDDDNKTPAPMGSGYYAEWVWSGDAVKQSGSRCLTFFGASVRRRSQDGFAMKYFTSPTPPSLLNQYSGTGRLWGIYAQQDWIITRFLRLKAGLRTDENSEPQPQTVSPYLSLAADAWKHERITASWSRAAQFPETDQSNSILGHPNLLPERSSQVEIAVEQPFGESRRMRLDVYDRQDSDLLFQPFYDPRILNGAVFSGTTLDPFQNCEHGYGKGAEFSFEQRSGNRLSGWVSYAYSVSRIHDDTLNLVFPSEFDLRHSIHIFGSFRVNPAWTVSGRFSFGTGLPEPAFLGLRSGVTYLATNRNSLRLADYQRTDLRIDKAFAERRFEGRFFVEVLNITNHGNYIFDSLSSFNSKTGQAAVQLDSTFPILPAAGIVLDF